MGASAFVGRVGGLAVALGIGAAVATGHGVASADTPGDTGSKSTPSDSATRDNTKATSTPSKTKTESTAAEGTVTTGEPDPDSGSTSRADAPTATSKRKTPLLSTVFSPKTFDPGELPASALPRTKHRSKVSRPESSTIRSEPTTAPAADQDPSAALDATALDTLTVPAPMPSLTAGAAPRPAAVAVVSAIPVAEPTPSASTSTPPKDPFVVVGTAISNLLSSIVGPLAANGPESPPDSPAMWTLLAAARQEQFGVTPTMDALTDPVTNGLVVAIPQPPLLAPLQQLPIIGPLFVTPVVAAISQIPIISDILHPFIGYPLQPGLPAGSPLPRDVKVISFDGTPIYVHFMPAAGLQAGVKAPTILDGPGLGMPGATNIDGTLLDGILTDNLGAVGIATLRNAGYNVVTWDPRGEWYSGGVLQVDSPDFEARDVSAIISWLATQPEVQLDSAVDLDPRIGMIGASYGGGIQLVTAATDPRVDAIVPTIAWNSLNTSLYKNESFKSGWGTLLEGVLLATFSRTNPRLLPAAIYGDLTGMVTQADQDLLAARGPDYLLGNITAPTLLIQGTVDTLFTLQEADDNAKALIANGVPTKVLWFCGGHGLCVNNLLDTRDGALIEQRTLEWLNRWVKGDTTVSTGPQFEWVDQRGQYFSSNTYPVPSGTPIVASSSAGGVLPLLPFVGGSALLGVLPIGGGAAINAVNLTIPAATTTTYIVGAPQLTFTYSGTGLARHVYAQLVDNSTGLVLGNQVTPIPVTLDGQQHTVSIPMEMVAHTLNPGETVTLQLVASAASYETIWSLGELTVSSIQLALPTADAAAVSPESVAPLMSVA